MKAKPSSSGRDALSLTRVPAHQSIDLTATFCRQDQDLREVRQIMEARGLDMMPVMDANQRQVGIVYRCEPR